MVGQHAGKGKHQTAPTWSCNIWCRGSTERMITDKVWHLQELKSVSCLQETMGLGPTAEGPHRGRRTGSTPDQPNAWQQEQGVLGLQPGLCGLDLFSAEIRDKRATGSQGWKESWGQGAQQHVGSHTHFNPRFSQRSYHPSLSEVTWCFLDSFLMQNHSVNDCSNFNSFLIHCLLLIYNPELLFSAFYCTKQWAVFINEKTLK